MKSLLIAIGVVALTVGITTPIAHRFAIVAATNTPGPFAELPPGAVPILMQACKKMEDWKAASPANEKSLHATCDDAWVADSKVVIFGSGNQYLVVFYHQHSLQIDDDLKVPVKEGLK